MPKTRKKIGRSKHTANVRSVAKRCAKEMRDRIRLGKPAYPGDDKCGAEHAGFRCSRESGHGGKHRGYRIGRIGMKEWKSCTQ